MEENKKTDFTKIRKILEKNNSASTWIFVFISIFTWLSVFALISIITKANLHGWQRLYLLLGCIFWFWLLSLFWNAILKWRDAENALLKHINDWTIIVKRPKISEFQYYYNRDSDGHSSSWYIVVAQDWWVKYKSSRISSSIFTWESWITIDKNYYIERKIPYSLDDPMYLKSEEYARVKEIDQQLKTLNDQLNYVDEKEKKKLNKEIKELEEEKISLLPQHLISRWATYVIWSEPIITECYIWDEINVFVCPDNPKNYLMEI